MTYPLVNRKGSTALPGHDTGPMRSPPDVGAVNKNLITLAKDFVNSKHYKDDYKKTPGVPE